MPRESHDDSPEAVGRRVRLIRIAYGILQKQAKEMSQAEFSRLCGITPQAWNNAETGDNRLGLDAGKAVRRRTGVGLDYIYEADERDLPHPFAVEIGKLEKAASGGHKRA